MCDYCALRINTLRLVVHLLLSVTSVIALRSRGPGDLIKFASDLGGDNVTLSSWVEVS